MGQSLRAQAVRLIRVLHSPAKVAGILLVAAFAVLYGLTLDNGLRPAELEGGDLITHQYAQAQARFANAPGYPLYTMGGWLWFRVGRLLSGAAANPIPILSSYSTFWALVGLGLLYVLALEAVRDGEARRAWPIALLATAFYGVTYFFWYYAVTTEQYTSSVAWTLAAVLLAFRWERLRLDRDLQGLALLTGVALAHQITLLAVIPPILWLVVEREPGTLRRGRLVAGCLGLALLPLLSYAYLYARGAQHPEWRGTGHWAGTWQWFWSFVSTSQGRSELTWSLRPFFTDEFPALLWRELTLPGLVAGLLGWFALGRWRGGLLYATLAIYLVICWVDRMGNWYQVIMPVYALLTVGIAAAATYAGGLPLFAKARARTMAWRAVVLIALLALIGYRGALSYPRADSSNLTEDTGLAPAWAILGDNPPRGAAVLGTNPEALALSYVTQIWGRRPDLLIVGAENASVHAADGSLVVTEAALPLVPAEVRAAAHYSALGRTLASVRLAAGKELPAGLAAWTHDFRQVQLVGGALQENRTTGKQVVLLAWQTRVPPQYDWSVSVRLIQGDAEIAQLDRGAPVFGAYPMTRWTTGEVVIDAYPFALPAAAIVDAVKVLVYRRAADGTFVNLDAALFAVRR